MEKATTIPHQQTAHAITAKRKEENFPVASWFLPSYARKGMLAFYNFARHADDIADHPTLPREEKLKALVEINRALVAGDEAAMPDWCTPYYAAIQRGEVGLRHGKALLSAFMQDATKGRYDTWDELIDYCMRSAAPVGRAVLELHREWNAHLKASDALCNVLQILNHLQDMKSDYRNRQRIYFPVRWLENPDYLTGDFAAPSVRDTIDKALDKCDAMLDEADALPQSLRGFRARIEICTIYHIARALSEKLRHCDPIGIRIALSKGEKFCCLGRGVWMALGRRHKHGDSASVTRKARTSFFWPLFRLPKAKREAMFALYAFCRVTDDAVDDAPSLEEAKKNIAFWRHEVATLYSDNPLSYPAHPISRALMPVIRQYKLQREHLDGMLDGLAMDLDTPLCRPSMHELDRYCYGVASCVGLLSIRIFGYKSRDTEDFALHMGKAFQLINILRDVVEDAGRARIYLPQELLTRHGLSNLNPREVKNKAEALKPVLRELGKQAREHFNDADNFLAIIDKDSMRPAFAMRNIYERYLEMLEANDFDITAPRVKLSGVKKVMLALR